jgi:hypothetical protein
VEDKEVFWFTWQLMKMILLALVIAGAAGLVYIAVWSLLGDHGQHSK